MENFNIYQNIAERTQGDIYLGVVGPVRTGKSTFIKRLMELMVIPNIENTWQKERAKDELPQSATGRTIMTTEPKFIPDEAVEIRVDENVVMKVRMVDCVGYMVRGAMGHMEDDAPRMVNTPWFDYQIPFEEAAEIGTKKVINEHSTIGLVVTTDGSITGIERENYEEAEHRVISELKAIKKPFVMLLNTLNLKSPDTEALRAELEEKYSVPVLSVDCMHMDLRDVDKIMEKVLYEFPVAEVAVNIPSWMEALDEGHWIRSEMIDSVKESFKGVKKLNSIKSAINALSKNANLQKVDMPKINLGDGSVEIELVSLPGLLFKVLGEVTGLNVNNERELFTMMKDLAKVKKEYDRVEYALHEVKLKGYGIVTPQLDELTLEEPEIVKQGSRFGVKLRASAPSIHMIRADIETEIAPLVGSEKQSEELVDFLLREFENDTAKLWESNIFGKSLHELVNEGLQNKLFRMPEDAQLKLQETLQKIINEGSGGLICIIL